MFPELLSIQDNAPGRAAEYTQRELQEREISVIIWPPFSPDLNPIEAVWNLTKGWNRSTTVMKLRYSRLRQAVRETWDAITQEQLNDLIYSIKYRCQAVIEANSRYLIKIQR